MKNKIFYLMLFYIICTTKIFAINPSDYKVQIVYEYYYLKTDTINKFAEPELNIWKDIYDFYSEDTLYFNFGYHFSGDSIYISIINFNSKDTIISNKKEHVYYTDTVNYFFFVSHDNTIGLEGSGGFKLYKPNTCHNIIKINMNHGQDSYIDFYCLLNFIYIDYIPRGNILQITLTNRGRIDE